MLYFTSIFLGTILIIIGIIALCVTFPFLWWVVLILVGINLLGLYTD